MSLQPVIQETIWKNNPILILLWDKTDNTFGFRIGPRKAELILRILEDKPTLDKLRAFVKKTNGE